MPEPLVSIAPLANDTLCVGPMLGQTPKPGLPETLVATLADSGARPWLVSRHQSRQMAENAAGADWRSMFVQDTTHALLRQQHATARRLFAQLVSRLTRSRTICGACCRGSGRALSPGWPPASLWSPSSRRLEGSVDSHYRNDLQALEHVVPS